LSVLYLIKIDFILEEPVFIVTIVTDSLFP